MKTHKLYLTLNIILVLLSVFLFALPTLAQNGSAGGELESAVPVMFLDAGDVLALLTVAAGLVVTVFVAWRRGTNVDAALKERIEHTSQEDRNRLELAYQQWGKERQFYFDQITALVKAVAAFTPIKADDAAGELLEDIKTQE